MTGTVINNASVSTSNSTNVGGNTTSSATIDGSAFLKLLVAELQYQDPTKPMDTGQLVQQLSSMSQVEQATQTNLKLSSILDRLSIGQATSLVGKKLASADGTQSGIVQAVRITSSGAIAALSDGSSLTLGQGIIVNS